MHCVQDTRFAEPVPSHCPESILPGAQEDVQLAHTWCGVCVACSVFGHVYVHVWCVCVRSYVLAFVFFMIYSTTSIYRKHLYLCMHVCMHVVCLYMYTCRYDILRMRDCACMHAYIYVYIYIYIYIHTYIAHLTSAGVDILVNHASEM